MTADLFLNDEESSCASRCTRPSSARTRAFPTARPTTSSSTTRPPSPRGAILPGGSWNARGSPAREAARARAGGIDFATTEAKVVLDAEGRPTDIALRRKTDATRLVEEAMILANETVAGYLSGAAFPACTASTNLRPPMPWARSFPCSRSSIGSKKPMEARLVAGIRRSSRRF